MGTMGRWMTQSAVCQLRQPRWKGLPLKSSMNMRLLNICQHRKYSQDNGCGESKKPKENCIDYKKNPCIKGHEPPEMPDLQPACPQIRISKRRIFLEKKACKELADKEAKKCDDDPCASFSRVALMRLSRKFQISSIWSKISGCLMHLSQLRSPARDPVYLNQERTFCRNFQTKDCLTSARSQRIVRKRKHLLAKQKKEAEAKSVTKSQSGGQNLEESVTQLKQAKDFKIAKGSDEATHREYAVKSILADIQKAYALHAQKKVCQGKNAIEMAAKEAAKLAKEKMQAKPLDCNKPFGETASISEAKHKKAQEDAEFKRVFEALKLGCQKKNEEFEKAREAERQKKVEEAALKKKSQMARLIKICKEAKQHHASKMAMLKRLCEEAKLKKQSKEATAKKSKEFQVNSKKEHQAESCKSNDDE